MHRRLAALSIRLIKCPWDSRAQIVAWIVAQGLVPPPHGLAFPLIMGLFRDCGSFDVLLGMPYPSFSSATLGINLSLFFIVVRLLVGRNPVPPTVTARLSGRSCVSVRNEWRTAHFPFNGSLKHPFYHETVWAGCGHFQLLV